jgi:hypothetical protein
MAERGRMFLVTEEQYRELVGHASKLPWYQGNPIMQLILALPSVRTEEAEVAKEETKEQELPLEPPVNEEWR